MVILLQYSKSKHQAVNYFSIEMERKRSREFGGRERLAPLPPWRRAQRHCLPGEQTGMCPLRHTRGRGATWSVHLSRHFCLPRARCWSGRPHRPLAGGNVYEVCKDEQRRIYIQNELQASLFFSILGSKTQACTFPFCTLWLVDRYFSQRNNWILLNGWISFFFFSKPLTLKSWSLFGFLVLLLLLSEGKKWFLRMGTVPQKPFQ